MNGGRVFVCAFVSARIICTHLYVDVIVSHVHSVAYRPEKILNMHKKRKFELNGRRNHRNVVACEQFLCAKSNYELFFSFFSLVQQQQLLYLSNCVKECKRMKMFCCFCWTQLLSSAFTQAFSDSFFSCDSVRGFSCLAVILTVVWKMR